MNFTTFLEQAWRDHGDHPQAVGEQLKGAQALLVEPAHVAALSNILVHVLGEHLGDWATAQAELTRLAAHPQCQGDVATSAVRVGRAALALAQGEVPQGVKLTDGERVRALCSACAVCLGREELGNAAGLFELSLKLVAAMPAESAGFERALAVAANNLACTLGELPQRDAEQDAQMLQAAQAARKYWEIAGTWLEVERAEYVWAKTCLRAGQVQQAAEHAAACLGLCLAHDAPAFEQFFAHEVAALAARALGYDAAFQTARQAALNAFAALEPADQAACQKERDALAA